MKKIVLITNGQPATNPRIVKEADALQRAGFLVTVLYSYTIDWATKADEVLLKHVPWKHQQAGGAPFKNKALYIFTKARNKLARTLNKYLGNIALIAERAQARSYDELLQVAKSIKADWYIGHNLGALAVCVNAARHHHAKAAFDFEDYHRGENEDYPLHEKKRLEYLEKKYVPSLEYISTASPMITQKIISDFPGFHKKIITLMNSFPVSDQPAFVIKNENDDSLKLFWFSQTIGKSRGIELAVEAIRLLNDKKIQLTLAGRCDPSMEAYVSGLEAGLQAQVHFAGIIQPAQLPEFASRFDIGLALETGFSTNNNIALSNKLFTYLLAGNAVILSETAMQKAFNEQYKIGASFPQDDVAALANRIKNYQDREKLNRQKLHNYELAASSLNWEKESGKLVSLVKGD